MAGKTLRTGRVRNDRRSLAWLLSPFASDAHALMEATRNWTVMFDWLDEIVNEVVLAPAKGEDISSEQCWS